MSCDFETTAYSKWILLGEHSVLRGHPAIAFPNDKFQLKLQYLRNNNSLISNTIIIELIQLASDLLKIKPSAITGTLIIDSNIPMKSGLGSSAALCVAISRWLKWYLQIDLDIIEFARQLENIFHGKSSGLDIAVIEKNQPIIFKAGDVEELKVSWQPDFRLYDSGILSSTAESVQKVQCLFTTNKNYAEAIDVKMHRAVKHAIQALNNKDGKLALTEAIKQGYECFEEWGLIPESMSDKIKQIYELGALAVKPTGSGSGGRLIGLC